MRALLAGLETELFDSHDLDDAEYSDDFKRRLLKEVETAERRPKAPPKRVQTPDWLAPKPAKTK